MNICGVILSTSDIWLLGICCTLFVVFIRLHFTATIRNRDIFNQAAKDFVSALQPELTRLKLENTPTSDIINPSRTRHSEACLTFCRYLRGRELKRFKLAWHMYYLTPQYQDEKQTEEKDNLFSQEDIDERTALIERIEALLDFAKFK